MKKLILLFAAILLASTTLLAETILNNVTYINGNGVEQTVNGVTYINFNNIPDRLEGWYIISCPVPLNVITGPLVCEGAVNLILADGAKLTVTGTESNPGIRVGENASLTIYGQAKQTGQLIVNGDEGCAGIGGGKNGNGSNITINGGEITINGGNGASGIGGGENGFGSNIKVATFLQVEADGNNPPSTMIENDGGDIADKLAGKQYVKITLAPLSATYIDANGEEQTAHNVTEITNSTGILSAGWYVVKDKDVRTGSLVCQGAVNLILADGAKLTAMAPITEYPKGDPGIEVSGEGNSLTIYGQANQSGELIATGDDGGGAGIGGGNHDSGSNITINGGIITANGNEGGAGIGGGYDGDGSNITINGGKVTANGNSAGIGGGDNGNGYNITINGGEVTANGYDGAGIGGGKNGSGSNIKVATELQVKADGSNPPSTEIENNGNDIASKLAGKRYVTITINPLPGIKTAAIAEIESAREGIQNAEINAMIDDAIDAINDALLTTTVNGIKSQILTDIGLFKSGKAEGQTASLGKLGEPCTDCPAIDVYDGTTTVTLYNPTSVQFRKVTE